MYCGCGYLLFDGVGMLMLVDVVGFEWVWCLYLLFEV